MGRQAGPLMVVGGKGRKRVASVSRHIMQYLYKIYRMVGLDFKISNQFIFFLFRNKKIFMWR